MTPPLHRRGSNRPRAWWHDAQVPRLTLVVFTVFAAALWLNAIINHYRFNVAIAVLASVPLTVLLARGALKARARRR